MGNGSLSSSNNPKNTNRRASIDKSDKHLALDFQFIDQKQVLIIENRVRFPPNATIRTVFKEFLELDEQNVISPDKVILVAICLDGRCFPVPTNAVRMTLHELKIENRSLLCFEPLSVKDRAKLSRLTLFSPHGAGKEVYDWDEKATLLMLLKYVIEVFNLNSVKRDNIQLCTFSNENLNQSNNLGKTLNELGLRNYHSIFVTLIKSTSYNNNGQDIHVHVESSSHGKILLHASCMNTVTELEYQIARRFLHSDSIDIELSNEKYEKLDKSNPKRTLRELGIKSGETMNAIIREGTSYKQATITNPRINTSQSSTNPLVVFVECTFLNHKSITIEVYVTDTVAEVTSKIAALRKNPPIREFYLYSESIDIDNKQPDRCLADFGIKPGSTIYANIGDINPTNTSLRSSSKYPVDSKPLGLVNLGNTCFMNSALQCLVHVSPLTHFFLDAFARVHTDDNDWNPFDTSGEVTGAYADIIWNMRRLDRKSSDDVHTFKPIRMKETIGCIAPHFATSDQQDAQEFMIFLLDAINNELQDKNKSERNTIIQQLFFGTMQSRITCLKCKHVTITTNRFSFLPLPLTHQERVFTVNFIAKNNTHDHTLVNVPANGRVENLVQKFLERRSLPDLFNYIVILTTNSGEQLKFDMSLEKLSENEVTLIEQEQYMNHSQPDPFNIEPDALKLEECLQKFVSLEQLDDLWLCTQSKCKQNTYANKQLQFDSLPRVLIIQLKRFSYTDGYRRKLDTFVDYPINGLNLSNLVSSSEEASIYDLIAVCNHIGSIYSGHYTAYARQDPSIDKWYRFDDNFVSTINFQDEIVSRNAYLLFYIKKK